MASPLPPASKVSGVVRCTRSCCNHKPANARFAKCPSCRFPERPRAPSRKASKLLLAVPVTAVLDSGARKLVYVEKSKGQFIPVEIVTGPRADDSYPVLSGLSDGDKVVMRGNFLLDSQFQIRGLPSLFYKEGQASAAGHQHGGASPPASSAKPQPQEHQH